VAGITLRPDVQEACDVLVTHEPPRGTLDVAFNGQHAGSERVRDMVMRFRPRVHTFGHIHESPGIVRLGGTLAVNCTMGDGKTGGVLIELTAAGATATMLSGRRETRVRRVTNTPNCAVVLKIRSVALRLGPQHPGLGITPEDLTGCTVAQDHRRRLAARPAARRRIHRLTR
jgi:hypothetical protein